VTTEEQRLQDARDHNVPWRKWGPYLSERQWGTVREDYSRSGDAWNYFPHDQARSRAYRWGEDGLAGISDDRQLLCRALPLWNGKVHGKGDRSFLESMFHKLLMNFTWWVNRKDELGNNVFEGGLLGLDNIGVFDRSAPLPTGGTLEQADGTSWMAMFCLDMLTIAVELALDNPVYEDLACKFFEHFIYIAGAMDRIGINSDELWDEEDGFYYTVWAMNRRNRPQVSSAATPTGAARSGCRSTCC
jgi:hypothetical protein